MRQYDEDEKSRPGNLNEAERAKSRGTSEERFRRQRRGNLKGTSVSKILFDFPFDFLGAALSIESSPFLVHDEPPRVQSVIIK